MELSALCRQHNFTLKNIRPIPGIEAELVEMVYDRTGTELCWVKSGESNKLFSICFKTLPEDDTGVFHILEHSVLGGSEKYPVKEPFVSLLKSSMNTFLNAMTFPDKTLYPVSSRNEQDFLNLTEVYLDAVFAPSILTKPNIFRQEGWHYEVNEGELVYNGVVFNEMKGAMSSLDSVSYQNIGKLLFPDNGYRWNSGGDPRAIPDLSYEQFVETYRRNYHPSNARIFLDGSVPMDKVLALLDEYLCRYEMGTRQQLEPQAPVSGEQTVYYEAANDGSPKARYVLGKIVGSYEDKTRLLAISVLCDVLSGSNDAPLKRAALSSGLCQDLVLDVDDGVLQPFMVLSFKNMEDKDAPALEALVRGCAAKLADEGIDKALLTASINRHAFRLQQMQEPQGLLRCINSLSSWLYEGDPMQYLHFEDSIAELREMAEKGGFEPLLREMLLDESGLCRLHVLPSEDYGARLREDELERLKKEKAGFDEAQLEEIAEIARQLAAWQQSEDSPEDEAKLPMLSLDQISPQPNFTETVEERCGGVQTLRHKAATNGIVHTSVYFDMGDCSQEDLSRLSLLSRLLGYLPTAKYSSAQLQNEIKTWIGSLKFGLEVFAKTGKRASCAPVLAVHCSALKENQAKALELIYEILTSTDFDQPERVREIVLQAETEEQQRGMMAGHTLAFACAQAHLSAAGAATEAIKGISYISALHALAKNFDERFGGFVALARETLERVVCTERMCLSLTEDGHSEAEDFVARFPKGCACSAPAVYVTALPRKLGIKIPAQVSFASIAGHLEDAGKEYDGSARIISNMLSLGYLWNEVRVQGGAYGAGMRIGRSGGMFTYSYRDPDPKRSLGVYRSVSEFIRNAAKSGQDITGYIISSIAETEPLVSPAEEGRIADSNFFAGFGYEQAAAERAALLSATAQGLESWCEALELMDENAPVCVVGYADALAAIEGLELMDI